MRWSWLALSLSVICAAIVWLWWWQMPLTVPRTNDETPAALPVISSAAPASAPVPSPSPRMPVTENATLAAFLDVSRSDRLTSDFPIRVPKVQNPGELVAVIALVSNHSDGDAERHEGIELLRRSKYAGLDALLWRQLNQPQEHERFRAFLVHHLGSDRQATTDPTVAVTLTEQLHSLLVDRHRAVRREALLALAQIKDPLAATLVHGGLDDPRWKDSADLILRCARELDDRSLMPAARTLAYSEDLTVRIAAINTLGHWQDETSRVTFEDARQSSVRRLQRAGELALGLLDSKGGRVLVTPAAAFREPTKPAPTPLK